MDRSVELIPLNCVRCGTPLPAEPDEAAWVCAQCGQGMILDPNAGLLSLQVNYSAALKPEFGW